MDVAKRELGEALVEVLSPEERDLLGELQEIPPAEVLERQTDDTGIEAVVPRVSVNQMAPTAKGST